jgi:hypothetical protein
VRFWATLAAYELVWFTAVIGAGHGHAWPGVAATLLFAAWRLAGSIHRVTQLKLVAVALLLGFLLETVWVRSGLIGYAAPWPTRTHPAWLMALWASFGLTVVPLFGYLHARPGLAAALGAVGGPLAYLGAARGWHAVLLPAPQWPSLLALAAGWGIALPTLTGLARYWLPSAPRGNAS